MLSIETTQPTASPMAQIRMWLSQKNEMTTRETIGNLAAQFCMGLTGGPLLMGEMLQDHYKDKYAVFGAVGAVLTLGGLMINTHYERRAAVQKTKQKAVEEFTLS